MPKLLYVIAHPGTTEKSLTLKVSDTFVSAWEQNNPEGTVDVVNLFETEPLYYTQAAFDTIAKEKFTTITGQTLTAEEQETMQSFERYYKAFEEADVVVFANPMWNYFLPAELKQYLDLIQVSGKSFKYTAEGPVGLLSNKEIVHIQAAGGFYHGTEMEDQDLGSKYIDHVMSFIGLDKVEHIYIEGAAFAPDKADAILQAAKDKATQLAAKLS